MPARPRFSAEFRIIRPNKKRFQQDPNQASCLCSTGSLLCEPQVPMRVSYEMRPGSLRQSKRLLRGTEMIKIGSTQSLSFLQPITQEFFSRIEQKNAARGLCKRNVGSMKKRCPLACGYCQEIEDLRKKHGI